MKDHDDYKSEQPEDDSPFGLTRPTGELATSRDDVRPGPVGRRAGDSSSSSAPLTAEAMEKAGVAAKVWKGFEEDEVYEPEVEFVREKDTSNEEMDMTPMVDVTFLLLIFFMVTASFTLQQSMEQPRSKSEDPSTNYIEEDDNDEFVQVTIDQYNSYRLTSRDSEEVEAASDNEMRRRLRDMVRSTRAKKLIIVHHGDAWHEKVITAWDAGLHNNVDEIVTQLTEIDF